MGTHKRAATPRSRSCRAPQGTRSHSTQEVTSDVTAFAKATVSVLHHSFWLSLIRLSYQCAGQTAAYSSYDSCSAFPLHTSTRDISAGVAILTTVGRPETQLLEFLLSLYFRVTGTDCVLCSRPYDASSAGSTMSHQGCFRVLVLSTGMGWGMRKK